MAASVLSAVLASGSTVLILDRTGALDRPAAVSNTGSGQQTASALPVTIDESSAVIDAAAKVGPAVVKITVAGQSTDPFGTVPTEGVGSGFIYDASGWILTNRHVVSGADTLVVELRDGRRFDGKVYGIDTLTDLAIVKVDATGLPTAPVGQSDGLKVGQLVVAIGSPLGTYSFSVTSGIVSGKGRDIRVDDGTRISNLIQTDAAINPGNSGGPLVDAAGSVVGVNTAMASDSSGIGFAIPIDIARPIMEQAVRGETLARPWIGITFNSINRQLKDRLGLSVDNGALVTKSGSEPAVRPGSPAEKAGLQDGDIVVALNGIRIDGGAPAEPPAGPVLAERDGGAGHPPRRGPDQGQRHPGDPARQPVTRSSSSRGDLGDAASAASSSAPSGQRAARPSSGVPGCRGQLVRRRWISTPALRNGPESVTAGFRIRTVTSSAG